MCAVLLARRVCQAWKRVLSTNEQPALALIIFPPGLKAYRTRTIDNMATNRPIVIGLTGGIAMGKSAVSSQFRRLGFPVHDSDAAVHELYAPGGAAVDVVSGSFGEEVRDSDGGISRPALAEILRAAPDRINELNGLVHPLVAQHRNAFMKAHANAFACVLDVPLLFESPGAADLCDVIVVASTQDPALQRQRALARVGMTAGKLDMILSKQLADAEKCRRADYIINTSDACLTPMCFQVAGVVDSLRERFPNEFCTRVWGVPSAVAPKSSSGGPKDCHVAPPVCVALDLDGTIWDTPKWFADLSSEMESIIATHLPRSYAAGIRYSDPTFQRASAHVRSTTPAISHDYGEVRKRAYTRLAEEHGDDVTAVDVIVGNYSRRRSDCAFRHLFDDTMSFLKLLKDKGILIASITDGNADISRSPELDKLFDFHIHSIHAGRPKPHCAPFLELLHQTRLRSQNPSISAADILVIGDVMDKDVVGAVNARMRAAWICRTGDVSDADRAYCAAHGVTCITSLGPDALATPLSSL
eukprot:m.968661 g.968661  ORF g.968661 m.968661 type:complete len:529 (+) comp23918_c0_seq1:75-1661(+)